MTIRLVRVLFIWIMIITILGISFNYLASYGIRPWQESDPKGRYFMNIPHREEFIVVDSAPVWVRHISILIGFIYLSLVVLAFTRICIAIEAMWEERSNR